MKATLHRLLRPALLAAALGITLPATAADVAGVRNLRGRIVTVVDMATHLGLGCVERRPETRLLIMEHQGETYGFLVDAVMDAVALDQVGKPPMGMDAGLRSRLTGVCGVGGHMMAILDPEALFRWDDA